jgi:hypothetical protein
VLIASAGYGATYAVDLATFVVSLIALARMRTPPPTERQPVGLKAIAEGLRFARSRQELLGTYLVDSRPAAGPRACTTTGARCRRDLRRVPRHPRRLDRLSASFSAHARLREA